MGRVVETFGGRADDLVVVGLGVFGGRGGNREPLGGFRYRLSMVRG